MTHEQSMGNASVVQSMGHGWYNHCTTHGAWGGTCCTTLYDSWGMGFYHIVWPMGHGIGILLYNPWGMGRVYYCTTHGAWGGTYCTTHGAWGGTYCTMLYDPWVMGSGHIVWLMGHGKIIITKRCTIHNTWAKTSPLHVVQPMPHGVFIPLYNVAWPMGLGIWSRCMAHGSWEKVAERCVLVG